MPGANASQTEVSGITLHGFWLLLDDQELFLSFADFPWFKSAPVEAVFHFERLHGHHLHWPDLDVDLDIRSIQRPEAYPLIARPSH